MKCPRCGQPICMCAQIPRLDTTTRFVILRHIQEADKASNSARLAHLALANSTLIDIGVKDQPFDPSVIPQGAALLFPGRGTAAQHPTTVVVVDGTWSQARHMVQRHEALWSLPRVEVGPPLPRRRLRKPRVIGGMSTLEAVAQVVAKLEDEGKGAQLDALYDVLVQSVRPIAKASDP